MEFELSSDQQLLLTSVESLLKPFRAPPSGAHRYVEFGAELQAKLCTSGFLEIAGQGGYGPLEAALIVDEIATVPVSVEAAASTLIAPLLEHASSPMSVAWGLNKPVRYLQHAKQLCVIDNDAVLVGTPSPEDFTVIHSVVAYPLALLRSAPRDARRYTGDTAAAIRSRALIGVAAEAAGLMRAALQLTVQYVKERRQFGQPLGHFQSIQHRLAEDVQLIRACRLLALRAAFEDNEKEAAVACLYAQDAIRKIIYDCHQFSGAMGLTLEYPLHLWTYRLKFLQGEAGGKARQAQGLATAVWG